MNSDPVIDRIREVRHRISEECDHDPKKIVEYYMDRQEKRLFKYRKKRVQAEHAKTDGINHRSDGLIAPAG
ncbi:MAG: hypothetical protein BWK80_43380 [Desulfobacteraceae bacterium IS3]|nr:MAG: hypothetical protein BWK80_43380 [Desulfobacteraceae bacterium IS3]HAO21346.1 hypothetical protein [Desulfobacteraceae bacterium]